MCSSDLAALSFERAAALRDKLDVLTWLHRHLEHLRRAAEHSFVYPVDSHDGSRQWYLIQGGRVRAALPVPRDAAARQAAAAKLEAVYGTDGGAGPLSLDEIDGVLLVAAWFRRQAGERERTLAPGEALAACRRADSAAEVTFSDTLRCL